MTWESLRDEYVFTVQWRERHIENRIRWAWKWHAAEIEDERPFERPQL